MSEITVHKLLRVGCRLLVAHSNSIFEREIRRRHTSTDLPNYWLLINWNFLTGLPAQLWSSTSAFSLQRTLGSGQSVRLGSSSDTGIDSSRRSSEAAQYFPRKHVITMKDYLYLTNPNMENWKKQVRIQQLFQNKNLKTLDKALDHDITWCVLPSNEQDDWSRVKTGMDFDKMSIQGFPKGNATNGWQDLNGFRVSKVPLPTINLKLDDQHHHRVTQYVVQDLGQRFVIANSLRQKTGHDNEAHFAGAVQTIPKLKKTMSLESEIAGQRKEDKKMEAIVKFEPEINYEKISIKKHVSMKRRKIDKNKNKIRKTI